jgi:hypothetical protein
MAAKKDKKDSSHDPNADGVCNNCGLEMDSASGKAACAAAPAEEE